MNRRNKAVLIVVSALLVIGLLAGGLYLKSIGDYKAKVNALTFDEIDLTKVNDGIYEGQCDTGVVRARVQVTVRDHRMESIELLEHENGRGTPAEAILDQMLQNQTTAVSPANSILSACSGRRLLTDTYGGIINEQEIV